MVRLPDRDSEGHNSKEPPSLADLSQAARELLRLVSSTDVQELHLESGEVRIIIKRGAMLPAAQPASSAVYTPPAVLPAPEASNAINYIGHAPLHDEVSLAEDEEFIVAPMVGTFYAAPVPNEPPFVNEGDPVEPGQTVGIIEAMKMMNHIEAEIAGHIARILVQNAQPVEYGQPLMVVKRET
jgi:acetyl-CoA carboxylase biotin carboxyl carrier protein